MANFFQQLIDLGEERGAAPTSTEVNEELESLSREQLLEVATRLTSELRERRTEYDALRTESTQLRSEYDAYKLKVESWQLKMKEARDEDRKLIAQLRTAGSSGQGNTDELMLQSMHESINKYKEELRQAHDNVAKEYRRRQEAEEARARAEEQKKEEVGTVMGRLERTREQLRKTKETFEARLKAADERAVKAERKAAETAARAASAAPAGAAAGDNGESEATPNRQEVALDDASPEPVPPTDATRARSGVANAAALMEMEQLRGQLETAQRDRDSLTEQLERLQRQLDEATEEAAEAERRGFAARSAAEGETTKLTARINELEKERSGHELEMKKLQRQVRVAEEEIDALKAARVAEERALQGEVERLRGDLSVLEAAAKERADAAGEAEQSSMRANEAMLIERRQMQTQMAQMERRLSDSDAMRQGLHETIEDLRQDLRRRDDAYEDLRRELDDQAMRCVELEAQLAANHATVTRREDDVVALERDRQAAKQQLAREADAAQRLKRQLAEADERLANEREAHADTRARLSEVEADRGRLETELRLESQKVADGAIAAETAQRMIRDLQAQLSEQGSRTADVVKVREDQSARVRQLESRLRDTEARLAAAATASAAAHERTSGGVGAAPAAGRTATHPSAILQSAFQQGRMSWTQSKYVLAVSVFLVLSMGFFYSFGNAPKVADSDSVLVLKEKYAQALQGQLSCRESLKGMCPCEPPAKSPA